MATTITDVAVDASRGVALPLRCARCEEPATVARPAPDASIVPRSMPHLGVPYCARCAKPIVSWTSRLGPVALGTALAATLLGTAAAWIPSGWPPASALVPAILAFAGGATLSLLPALQAMRPAVFLREAKDATWIIACENPSWAADVAAANGSRPWTRRDVPWRTRLLMFLGAWSALLAGAVGVVAFLSTHARVRVDNPRHDDVRVWVDGQPSARVPDNPEGNGLFSLWLKDDRKHVLGWSPVTATTPSGSVSWQPGDNVYVPGAAACHWVERVNYGPEQEPSGGDRLDTPLPIAELRSISGIDVWMEPPPSKIRIGKSSPRRYRTVLVRNRPCTSLAMWGCPTAVLDTLVECQRKLVTPAGLGDGAETEAAATGCFDRAKAACDAAGTSR